MILGAFLFFIMNEHLKISRGIHKLTNSTVEVGGVAIPCVYSGLARKEDLDDEGHGKNPTIDTMVTLPLYDKANQPYDLSKFKIGEIYTLRSTVRTSQIFRFRPTTRDLDDASITSVCTDHRR